MKRISDTTPEVEAVLARSSRSMSPGRRWHYLGDLNRMGRQHHEAGIRLRDPSASRVGIRNIWISRPVGPVPPTSSVRSSLSRPRTPFCWSSNGIAWTEMSPTDSGRTFSGSRPSGSSRVPSTTGPPSLASPTFSTTPAGIPGS